MEEICLGKKMGVSSCQPYLWAKTLEKLEKTLFIIGADRIGAESDSGVFKWK